MSPVRTPQKAARRIEAQRDKLVAIGESFGRLKGAITDEQFARLSGLHEAYRAAQSAAEAAAGDLFADEPLPDVGSEVWRALWEAARDYSTQKAYPDLTFPVTSEGARCVLCQQELNAEAADRMAQFEKFVKDETKRKEEQAQDAYVEVVKGIAAAGPPISDVAAAVAFVRDDLNDGELAVAMQRALVTSKWRLRAILRHHADEETAPLPAAAAWPDEAIAAHETALSDRISALRAEDESDERAKLTAELHELSDREWLAAVQEDMIAEIGRRKKIAALKVRAKDTATNKITTKSGEIAEQLVTNTLRAEFARQIDRLGVAGLLIELRKEKSSYGVPRFRVSLIRKPEAKVGEVLSEGEHRCVALAAFLAELATTESRSAIVFDDPVSSLDHMHREAVAKRLAAEGEHRQIIVLTHDIAFLFLLDQECREKGTHIAFRSVTRTDDYAGFCQPDPPARAQPIEKVIEGMQKQLDNQKVLYENGDHDGWERAVDALQKRLRSTWERAVEEAVGPVLKRLSNKVETKGLAKLTTLTMDDCTTMWKAYGRCSVLLHSSTDALNSPLPKPDAVQHEITALKKWVEDVKARQAKIEYLQ
ncbi:AAA family ATPase [Chelativorans intermedius]|uniref:AAA family ATPase n=1 Tax=Chelativorans intermedius TaxID=515947 RepID=A0ABV6DCK9_9HYPH|nr:AAA family ATPase [Chelativorans intermedius]MCT9000419.1 AAA family ATPase [Chelativorans intermedius]